MGPAKVPATGCSACDSDGLVAYEVREPQFRVLARGCGCERWEASRLNPAKREYPSNWNGRFWLSDHPVCLVVMREWRAWVDVGISAKIRRLWRVGIETFSSCQDGWICFKTMDDAHAGAKVLGLRNYHIENHDFPPGPSLSWR